MTTTTETPEFNGNHSNGNSNGTSNGNPSKESPRGILLVSVPRTASNLLVRVLNIHNQPHVVTNQRAGYFFYEAYMLAARELMKPADQWTESEKSQVRDAYQAALDRLEEMRAQAQREGKVAFAKEHAFWTVDPEAMYNQDDSTTGDSSKSQQERNSSSLDLTFPPAYGDKQTLTFSRNNRTFFPDAYLVTWRLAFIIRHPALAWPSMYRAMRKMVDLQILDEDGVRGASMDNMSLTWTRKLHDWCLEKGSGVPLVMDAHDVIHSPGAVLKFCEMAGLDKNAVQFEWSATVADPKEGWQQGMEAQAARIMLSTLEASTGLVKGKAPATVDVKAEAEKWREEFGEEAAGLLEKAVWDAMPDYEYLRERRVQA